MLVYFILILVVAAWSVIYFAACRNKPFILEPKHAENIGVDCPLVSIIIPARDEEAVLPGCLASLAGLNYPAYEVIVVDDFSTDQTYSIADLVSRSQTNFKVVRGRRLPSGWTGKSWANHQGARESGGEWLLFTDADTEFSTSALSAGVVYAKEENLDMLSVLPNVNIVNFWDKVTLPIVGGLIIAGSPLAEVNDPRSAKAMAVGAYILIKRRVYELTGGHAAIRRAMVDDKELAILVKSAGYKLRVLNGPEIYQVEMYHSFQDVWEGWSKNLFLGMDKSYVRACSAIAAIFLLNVFPILVLLGWLMGIWGSPEASLGLGGLILGSNLTIIWIVGRLWKEFGAKIPPTYVLCLPLGGAIVIGLILNSIFRYHQGIPWKGRKYHPE